VPILFPDRFGGLLIRNVAPGGVRSRIVIEDTALLAGAIPRPDELVASVPLSGVNLTAPVKREETAEGLMLSTDPGMGAYAARAALPLSSFNDPTHALRLHVWLRVTEG